MFTNLIKKELNHYKTLPHRARFLVTAYNLRSIAQPILSLFINAFIWRMTSSIMLVLVYSLGYFFALPFGFIVNGKVLRKFSLVQTHFVGNMLSILGATAVIFFHSSSVINLLIFGMIYGFGNGIYWSSRNYLSYQETNPDSRTYFFSIVSAAGSLIVIIVSFLVGWIIAFSDISKLYSAFTAYIFVSAIAIISLFVSGLVLLKLDFKTPKISSVWHPRISKRWNIVRAVNFSVGIFETIVSLITTLLILNFLGNEGILGTIGAVISVLTIVLMYFYGRFSKDSHRERIFFIMLIVSALLASILAFGSSNFTILLYVLFAAIPPSFFWLVFYPWQMNIMDEELISHESDKYPLVVDCEIFLDLGRIIAILIFMGLIYIFSSQVALLITPLVLAILQIILFAIFWKKISWKNI